MSLLSFRHHDCPPWFQGWTTARGLPSVCGAPPYARYGIRTKSQACLFLSFLNVIVFFFCDFLTLQQLVSQFGINKLLSDSIYSNLNCSSCTTVPSECGNDAESIGWELVNHVEDVFSAPCNTLTLNVERPTWLRRNGQKTVLCMFNNGKDDVLRERVESLELIGNDRN